MDTTRLVHDIVLAREANSSRWRRELQKRRNAWGAKFWGANKHSPFLSYARLPLGAGFIRLPMKFKWYDIFYAFCNFVHICDDVREKN